MKTFRQMFPIVTAAIAVCALMGTTANAAFLVGGNTRPRDPGPENGPIEASISYAVYSRTGPAGDSFGLGVAGVDAALATFTGGFGGNFLYLYQLVNDGPNAVASELYSQVSIVAGPSVIGRGILAGLGLIDASGAVTVGNPFGNNGPFVNELAPADFTFVAPAVTVGAAAGGAVNATLPVAYNGFNVVASFSPNIGHNGLTTIFGYTSNLGPWFGTAGLIDGLTADGVVLVPTTQGGPELPVPGTALLFGSLFPVLAGAVYRKRNQKIAA